ncbi:MAG: DUF1501 domain-containing protein [Planctomycetes bacterium]|nr:DUF1501 domain-containing protein [Planctomycetota bacterium]
MLTIPGPKHGGFCDKISRRTFLQIGSLAMGGLSLPQVLRAEAASGVRSSHKAVIMIFLSGGPPHQDMVDLKPDAPAAVRGEFNPINTNVPGIQICEHLPRMAAMMDKWAIIRSIVGSDGRHASFMCQTGRPFANQPPGGWPSLGSVVSKLQGPTKPSVPPFVGLSPKMKTSTWADPGQPGFLGLAHAPFQPMADGKADMLLNGVTLERLSDRRALLASFDQFRRSFDASGAMDGMDKYAEQAFGILTSSKLAEALDIDRENTRLRDRYGRGSPDPAGYGDAGPLLNDYFLMARRLVESGVRVVTLAYGRWDWHGKPYGTTFENARGHIPMLDIGLSALVEDLYTRGLEEDVSVIVWGEFGRTPKINPNAGRDHWPEVSCALLAGGGMRTGQVIGSTNRYAERPKDRPVQFQEVFATLYHNLGIDTDATTVPDLQGRPQYLIDHVQPIRELV